jgi:hypothetical protein
MRRFDRLPGIVLWLRFRVRTIEKEGDNFLKYLFANVYRPMYTIGRFDPIYFACGDAPGNRLCAIAELDIQPIAAENNTDTVKGIVMPRRCFAWR